MLNVLRYVLIVMLGLSISCTLFLVGGWLAASLAEYLQYEPYQADPGHERAAERNER